MNSLSPDQKTAVSAILKWYKAKKNKFITLGGYAGTGKTTLIGHLRSELAKIDKKLKVGFASYTGKAARVLRSTLRDQDVIHAKDTVGTIHSLIYSPVVNEKEEIVGWKQKEKLDRSLIIIDEASMVDSKIWSDLLSYKIPIIAVGDHGQLPPIQGNFNLMQSPAMRLQQIHRQAEKNPIIGLSIQARENGVIRFGRYSDTVAKFNLAERESHEIMEELMRAADDDTLILCGYNSTRQRINNHIRTLHDFSSPAPQVDDRVICLRNNHKKHIFNGMLGTISSIYQHEDDWYEVEIAMDDMEKPYRGIISVKQFGADKALNYTTDRRLIMQGDLFDFGYALTVHKAQGSQAKRVVLFEERFKKMKEYGADACFSKPLPLEQLKFEVANLLRLK